MKATALFALILATITSLAAETSVIQTNHAQAWLTNTFRPWLTRSYPEVNSKFYPEWLHDHPGGLLPGPFTNWLSNVFPDLETEMFPTWMDNFSPDTLGTNIPAWWGVMLKGKYSVSPAAQPLPTIVRGPYLQLGTTNSMVVRWRTDRPSGSAVSYGSSPGRMNRNGRSSGIFTEHAVQITNLAPDTKYYDGLGPIDTPLPL